MKTKPGLEAEQRAMSTNPLVVVHQATPMEKAMEAAREYARPTTNAVQERQLLDNIRFLLGGGIGVPVPRVVAEAMGLSEDTITNWPADL